MNLRDMTFSNLQTPHRRVCCSEKLRELQKFAGLQLGAERRAPDQEIDCALKYFRETRADLMPAEIRSGWQTAGK
jgi:hypothetical protein